MNKCFAFAVLVSMSVACNDSGNTDSAPVSQDSLQTISGADSAVTTASDSASVVAAIFDLSKLPISEKELGEMPFFPPPHGIVYSEKPVKRDYDKLFFPINGVMTPLEGKVFKSYMRTASGDYNDWSYSLVEKNFDDAVKAAGGVKIWNARISQQEADRFRSIGTNLGEEGSLDYWNDPVHMYVIRRKDGDNIYIQWSGNTAGASVQILQQTTTEQAPAAATDSSAKDQRKLVM